MDLNKEIKLSDFFRRKKGPVEEDVAVEERSPKERRPRKSFSFSRAQEKEPKEKANVSPRSAPALPSVPLMPSVPS